jgi:putative phosphoribosyl transferase
MTSSKPHKGVQEADVQVPTNGQGIGGTLAVPPGAAGLVVFAHGSGSGRFSPRNRMVAEALHQMGLATLLVDLLTREEERVDLITREHRFDIDLLAGRVIAAIDWAPNHPLVGQLPIGLFGASTGAAAALVAAAHRVSTVAAVVSRGGRPDLAGPWLERVQAPTLLIVGGADLEVLALNQHALRQLRHEKRLAIVPGASHLFEEPGTMERVCELAGDWFTSHLAGTHSAHPG